MGMSSEAFDRLKEAHFMRDVGLARGRAASTPSSGSGSSGSSGWCWASSRRAGSSSDSSAAGAQVVTSWLFALTVMELVTMLASALTRSTWLAIGAVLGVLMARKLIGPLWMSG